MRVYRHSITPEAVHHPELVAWLERLTDDERDRVRYDLKMETGANMSMTFYVADEDA